MTNAGGTLVIACWCQREETPETPLSKDEKDRLQFLYDEWAHPYFISNLHFGRLMEVGSHANNASPSLTLTSCCRYFSTTLLTYHP